jgi:exodeoxyribonuclease V
MYTGLFRNDDPDAVVFLTYSNKLAVDVNLAIRRQLFEPTEDLIAGEQVMVVRNNYAWGDKEFPFIANGEMGKVIEVISGSAEEKYGFKWADVIIEFQNLSNNPVEVMCKVVLDLLSDRKPQLSFQDLQQVHRARRAEYEKLPAKPKSESLKNDPYLNALQIKYGYAVTGHKAQGGQWRNVIVAFEPMYKGMSSQDYLRWSYTAVTRAEDRLFMLNFPFGQKDF